MFTFCLPAMYHNHLKQATAQIMSSFTWQDIVEDERSDKEETESEDEDDDHQRREKSKNGHVQNGHTPLNSNHRKRDWLDRELEMKPCAVWRRALTCGHQLKAKEQKYGMFRVAATHIKKHTYISIHFFLTPRSLMWIISLLCGSLREEDWAGEPLWSA